MERPLVAGRSNHFICNEIKSLKQGFYEMSQHIWSPHTGDTGFRNVKTGRVEGVGLCVGGAATLGGGVSMDALVGDEMFYIGPWMGSQWRSAVMKSLSFTVLNGLERRLEQL